MPIVVNLYTDCDMFKAQETLHKRRPELDFMEQSISGPVTTDEQRRIVAAVKRRLTKIKQAIKGVFK